MPNKEPHHETVPLSKREMELIRTIAERDGITEDEAATRLVEEGIKKRMRRGTGYAPAPVLKFRKQ